MHMGKRPCLVGTGSGGSSACVGHASQPSFCRPTSRRPAHRPNEPPNKRRPTCWCHNAAFTLRRRRRRCGTCCQGTAPRAGRRWPIPSLPWSTTPGSWCACGVCRLVGGPDWALVAWGAGGSDRLQDPVHHWGGQRRVLPPRTQACAHARTQKNEPHLHPKPLPPPTPSHPGRDAVPLPDAAQRRACTHARTHAHTHTHARAHTHMRTHTRAQPRRHPTPTQQPPPLAPRTRRSSTA